LQALAKASRLSLADFVVFTGSFGNLLEICWVCEKQQQQQGLSPAGVIQHRSGRRGGVHVSSLGYDSICKR